MAKHAIIYPSTEELDAVQTLVSTVESALKRVSDWMDNLNHPSGKTTTTSSSNKNDSDDLKDEESPTNTKYVPLCLVVYFVKFLATILSSF